MQIIFAFLCLQVIFLSSAPCTLHNSVVYDTRSFNAKLNGSLVIPIFNWINPVLHIDTYFLKFCFNIVLSYMPRLSYRSLSCAFAWLNFELFQSGHIPCSSWPCKFNHPDQIAWCILCTVLYIHIYSSSKTLYNIFKSLPGCNILFICFHSTILYVFPLLRFFWASS